MDSASDSEISAAVSAFIGDRPGGEVVTALYHARNPALAQKLAELSELLPIEQISIVRLVERLNLSGLPAVVLLSAVLGKIRTEEEWIHYNLAHHLWLMLGAGVPQAKLPAIIHALLARHGLQHNPDAQPLLLSVLSRELTNFAPREAIRCGMLAARHGDERALHNAAPAFTALDIEAISGRPSVTQLLDLATKLRLGADNLPNFAESTNLAAANGLRSVLVEHARRVVFPEVRGDHNHYIFRAAGKPVDLPAITVHTFENGIFSIDARARGLERHYVFDRNGDCVLDLANGAEPFIAEPVLEFDEPIAVLDDRFSGTMNICHFLLDRLTRIPLYERTWSRPGKFLLVDDFPYYREMLARLGFADRVIIPPSKRVSVRAPELLFSSNIAADFRHPAHYCAGWAIDYLRRSLGIEDHLARPGRKLVISRKDTNSRNILNWQQVAPIFERYGFEIVELAGLPSKAQIELFREASHVVGVHGGGLTNILFASRKCTVLEILPPFVAVHDYWLLASTLGQRYFALTADDPEMPHPDYTTWQHNDAYNNRDIVLDPERLATVLAGLDNIPIDPALSASGRSSALQERPSGQQIAPIAQAADLGTSDPEMCSGSKLLPGLGFAPESETIAIQQVRLALERGDNVEARQRFDELERLVPACRKKLHERFSLRGAIALAQANTAEGALDPESWVQGVVISEDPVIILSDSTSVEVVERLAAYYRDRVVYFFIGVIWSLVYDNDLRQRYHDDYQRVSAAWPNFRITILANDVAELNMLRDIGVPAVLVNQNAFVDESVFRILETERKFDAVYTARAEGHKRHDLAANIDKLTLVITAPTAEGVDRLQSLLPGCSIANGAGNELRHLSPDEVAFHLNSAKCGLCLSPVEGAMFASMEYLLCGLPIVTIENIGGRNWFFSHDYAIFTEAHPAAVADAVSKLIRRDIPREYVRQAALERVKRERQVFFSLIEGVFRENGQEGRRFEPEFNRIFFDKMNYNGRRLIELLVP